MKTKSKVYAVMTAMAISFIAGCSVAPTGATVPAGNHIYIPLTASEAAELVSGRPIVADSPGTPRVIIEVVK